MGRHLAWPTGAVIQDLPSEIEVAPEGVACEYCEGPYEVHECPKIEDISSYDVEGGGGIESPVA